MRPIDWKEIPSGIPFTRRSAIKARWVKIAIVESLSDMPEKATEHVVALLVDANGIQTKHGMRMACSAEKSEERFADLDDLLIPNETIEASIGWELFFRPID